MYICNLCNYQTEDKSNFNHHNKSKKHLFKLNTETKNNENIKLQLKEKEIEELKQELIKVKEEKKEFEIKAQIYKELSEKAKNINQGIIINNTNNLSYVNKHFRNAPPLKKISNYNLNGIDLDDDTQIDKLTENIIYSYKNKCLHKLIGDHIIKHYKKDDLNLQSFHATDVARRKYLVKLEDSLGYLYSDSTDEFEDYDPEKNSESGSESEISDEEYDEIKKDYDNSKIIIKKNKSKWTNDNEGVKISYLLFEPVIRKIIRQLKKKCRDYNNEMKKNIKKIPTKEEAEIFEVLANILKELDKDKLKKNINNYIAPHFGLVKK